MRLRSLFFLSLGLLYLLGNTAQVHAIDSDLEISKKWIGDFDGMADRHLIRALVPPSKTFYFLDGADQRGLTFELLKAFETYVNIEQQRKAITIKVVVIPTRRDRLLPALAEGFGEIAAGNLTITPARRKKVDFSAPHLTGVDEIVISGPATPPIKTLEDLSGKEIHVRKSSSYYESLMQLNNRFKKSGKPPVKIIPADEYLEDEDLLEMMNAGLIPLIVIDSHKAEFWAQNFKNEPMSALDKMLFTFASYNAGPGRIMQLRRAAHQAGFNPNVWFRNVEIIAARQIGAETVHYVGNIYKYYIAYRYIVKEFGQKKKKASWPTQKISACFTGPNPPGVWRPRFYQFRAHRQ